MPTKQNQKSGGGSRKKGRNRVYCTDYQSRGMREKNKLLRMIRTSRRQPGNAELANRIAVLSKEWPSDARYAKRIVDQDKAA